MIGITMGDNNRREFGHMPSAEEWHHYTAAGIVSRVPRTTVNQDPSATRSTNGDCVTLTDRKEVEHQAI